MKRNYHTIDKERKVNARKLGEFLPRIGSNSDGDLIEQCRMISDELIDVAGRANDSTGAGIVSAAGRRRAAPARQTAQR